MHLKVQGAMELRRVPGERLPQAAIEFGIAGFPNFVADVNAVEIDVAVAEGEPGFVTFGLLFVDASPLLFLIGMARIEHDTVTWLEWSFEMERDAVAFNAGDFTEVNAALFPEARMDQSLIVDAAEPPSVETAGKTHLEVIACV